MENIYLIEPSPTFEEEYLDMVKDWEGNDINNIPWYIKLNSLEFSVMVKRLLEFSKGIGIEEGYVPNSTYWLVDNNREIIGAINIRHILNDFFLNYAGQIGYGIRPSERKKGYAKHLLHLGLEACKHMKLQKVLLCCYESNVGSIKTIVSNGGILESKAMFNGQTIHRYWILL